MLLTGDEETGALAALRALSASGYDVWLATAQMNTYAARSRAAAGVVSVPDAADAPDACATALAEAAERLAVDLVLPGTEKDLVVLSTRRDRFASESVLGVPSADVVARTTDKEEVLARARRAGLETPETAAFTRAEVAAAAADLRYPAVVKPARTKSPASDGSIRHGRAARVADAAGLRAAVESLPGDRFLVQPFVKGRLAAIGAVAWEGRIVAAVHQVAERIWPPDCGISAYAATVERDEQLEAAAARLLASLGWSGIVQLQFLRRDGRSLLVDLNPRPYGSLALAVAAGVNLPQLWVELLLGGTPRANSYRVGVRYRVEEKDMRALIHELVRGRRQAALAGLVPRPRTVHAVFSLRDPAPLLTTVTKAAARLARA